MKIKIIPNEQTPKIQESVNIEEDKELLSAFTRFVNAQTMCIGLASNQCSVDGKRIEKRFFSMMTKDAKSSELIINPYLISCNGKQVNREEGCLTWRGKTLLAKRYLDIKVKYYGIDGKPKLENMTGIRAIIFQHEFDHLQGKEEILIDR